ncbi:MAG: hypothetical protein PUA93_05355 [Eubacteriales bacterium]|nr:hypothetical protein [Eubacteriales bacterium]
MKGIRTDVASFTQLSKEGVDNIDASAKESSSKRWKKAEKMALSFLSPTVLPRGGLLTVSIR